MAPMRGERGGSPARAARASLPLPRRLIRQIARHVASSGRSLQRLEISGRVIDNFDDLDAEDSDTEPGSPVVASAGGVTGALMEQDDELTSLSWLQDRNLLRGINLSKGDTDDTKSIRQVIYQGAEPSGGDTPPPAQPPSPPSPPATPVKPPAPPPAPLSPAAPAPLATSLAKPPYSFSCLIFMAIEASATHALPVKEIYAWIVRHFPYFREAPQGWKNSVRHNLSLNKCFHKVATATTLGKGSLWTVDPQHRPGLLQAFGRQPVPRPADEPPPEPEPEPALFPFLARRLAAPAGAAAVAGAPGVDEYLAAATVLAMKYGPGVLERLPPAPAPALVISRSPRDEHAYSGWAACDERRTAEALLNLAGVTSEPEPPAALRKRKLHHR